MKKFFLSLISILFVSMMAFNLSSCSEEEVEPGKEAEALVGKWKIVASAGMDFGDGTVPESLNFGIVFKSDGKCYQYMMNEKSIETPYSYDSTNSMLHIEDGEDWEYTRIVFLNKNKFKMYFVDEYGKYDSEEFTATFERQ